MRLFIVCSWILISSIAVAQDLHKFSNGEVADAEKINENFQYLLDTRQAEVARHNKTNQPEMTILVSLMELWILEWWDDRS